MPLKIGNTSIGAIYLGNTPISSVYKGTSLVFSSYIWEKLYYEYLYHNLVPQYMNKSGIPETYQEVEYIESSGTQYIDTNYIAQPNTWVHAKLYTISTGNKNWFGGGYTAGGYQDSYKYFFIFNAYSHNTIETLYGQASGGTAWQTFVIGNIINRVFTVDFGKDKKLYIDGTQIADWTYQVRDTDTANLCIFVRNNGTAYIEGRLYEFKIYEDNILIRDYIPCYRKSDNVIGLYDKVNGVFYTNAGTGTFSKGADVKVAVKNKAKVDTLYGNSVVENQIAVNGNFESISNWYNPQNATFAVSDNIGTLTLTSGATTGNIEITKSNFSYNGCLVGHKYLIKGKVKTSYSGSTLKLMYFGYQSDIIVLTNIPANTWVSFYYFYTISSSYNYLTLRFTNNSNASEGDTINLKELECTDFTQRNPFDTPTTSTDVRVQAIINRDYIAYNTGTIKNVDIGAIVSESFNIWDEQWETGTFQATTGVNQSGNGIRSKNYISVIPNTTYYCYKNTGSDLWCMYFDENYNVIPQPVETDTYQNLKKINNKTFTLPSNCKYIRFYLTQISTYNNDICINVSSSLNGTYKPHKSFSPLTFHYQGAGVPTSHDTMQKTKTEWVFTKNVNRYTFIGSESWSVGGQTTTGLYRYYYTRNEMKTGSARSGLCDSLPTDTGTYNATTIPAIRFGQANNAIYVYLTQNFTASEIASYMTGKTVEYQLATPQVIRIPKGYLGVVDLGSLNWIRASIGGGNYGFYAVVEGIKLNTALVNNLYDQSSVSNLANLPDKKIWNVSYAFSPQNVVIRDDSYTDAATFKQAMQGVYLFYETASEVADIPTTFSIEAGGTITTDSEVLPNALFDIATK